MSVSRALFWEICTMKAPSSLFLQLCCVCVYLFILDEYGKMPLDWTLKGYFSPTRNLTCDRQEVRRASLLFVLLPAQFLGLALDTCVLYSPILVMCGVPSHARHLCPVVLSRLLCPFLPCTTLFLLMWLLAHWLDLARAHPSLRISWWVSCLLFLSRCLSNSHVMLPAPPSPVRALSLHASLVSSFSILVFVVPPVPIFGEGNGNPLQYSCLEDSRDRGT